MEENHPAANPRYSLAPEIALSGSGAVKSLEHFGDYVARQLGLIHGSAVASRLAEVAMDYLGGDKSSGDHSHEGILVFLSKILGSSSNPDDLDQDESDSVVDLHRKLVEEIDACMISYMAFHWHHASELLDHVQRNSSSMKLRHLVLAATRKERFKKIMSSLKTKRTFSTLLETLKAMGHSSSSKNLASKEVVVAADSKLRSPVLLLIGGGMGAGKSTVVKDILAGSFWSAVAKQAVVVEADAFKETDVVYRTISSSSRGDGGDIAMASQLVHSASTMAASSLLVSALNDGRDVIFDGTMMWEPFVTQTIAMARDVHRRRYRIGRGYVDSGDGSVIEEYWVPVDPEELLEDGDDAILAADVSEEDRKPYRIEFVGVTCEPLLAVVRGIRRAIIAKRAVPIQGQLRSHRLFATSLGKYCEMVDLAKIYSTNGIGEPPELIGWKDNASRCRKVLVDPGAFQAVTKLTGLNERAGDVFELFEGSSPADDPASAWNTVVVGQSRKDRQDCLRRALTSAKDRHARKTISPTTS